MLQTGTVNIALYGLGAEALPSTVRYSFTIFFRQKSRSTIHNYAMSRRGSDPLLHLNKVHNLKDARDAGSMVYAFFAAGLHLLLGDFLEASS